MIYVSPCRLKVMLTNVLIEWRPTLHWLMQANRMADALLIADLAGREELSRVQQLYMKKQPSPYMRVVKAIQGNDFVSKSPVLCCSLQLLILTMLIKHHVCAKVLSVVVAIVRPAR